MLKGFLYAPVKLTPEQIHHVEEKFSESLQDQVQLVPQTDKSLIGGIRVEIDGRVYDGTIKKRLTIKDDSGDIDFASDADNFEWLEGTSARFGLVEVDFSTMERRVKKSGRFYSELINRREISPDMYEEFLSMESYHH